MKHNVEQTVANTDTETLPKVARNILKILNRMMLVYDVVVDIFSTCCKAVLYVLPKKQNRKKLSYCTDVTKAYKHCCSSGYV
jgi:tRNA(Met) C34 N-acetyltransferase TmcA